MKKVFIAAGLALSVVAAAQVDPARVVMVINGEEIKGAEYYRRMEYMRTDPNLGGFPHGFVTLLQIISERLVFQIAREKGVSPTEAEIKAYIAQKKLDDPDIEKDFLASGRTAAEFFYEMKHELAEFKIRTAGITVTDQEIDQFYRERPNLFTTPKRYELRFIAVDSETLAKAVDSDLASGKDFGQVAAERSLDITRTANGKVGTVPIDVLPEAARKHVAATKIGKTTPWFDQSTFKVKYEVVNIIDEKLQPLNDKLRRTVRKQMMLDRGAVKNNVRKDMLDARTKAKISIKDPGFAKLYEQFSEALAKRGA